MIGNKYYTIAEIASAHNGEVQEVHNILNKFGRTGFDYLKFQVFKLEELVNIFEEKNSVLKNIEISTSSWQMIFKEIEENLEDFKNIKFIAEPYDLSSLELCKEFKIFDSYKVPTSDLSNLSFIENFLNITDNLYLGTGGSEINEITETINFIKNKRSDIKIKLIHGFQSYPTNVEDMDLWKISFLKEKFDLEVGFADHSDASSEVLRYLPATLALTFGADFIEKHITMDRSQKKPDYYSSLNPGEINNFLFSLNAANNLLFRGKNYLLSESENKYRKSMKKFAIAKKDISKGEIISGKNVVFKRSLKGNISISEANQIIDKVALNSISKGSPILRENILEI